MKLLSFYMFALGFLLAIAAFGGTTWFGSVAIFVIAALAGDRAAQVEHWIDLGRQRL